MGPDAMILVFWMLSFKPTFHSLTFIKRLSSSSLSAVRVMLSAYLRLLILATQPGIKRESPAFQSQWLITGLLEKSLLSFLKPGNLWFKQVSVKSQHLHQKWGCPRDPTFCTTPARSLFVAIKPSTVRDSKLAKTDSTQSLPQQLDTDACNDSFSRCSVQTVLGRRQNGVKCRDAVCAPSPETACVFLRGFYSDHRQKSDH